ncbi:chemotaxis protein CheX [Helicobacter burdigaliensis]|uniref:chemotaxis protein CheX n=1 Tax=Helicobacter burdigaliensis TaxID=2315334 RepID=UPI000EF66C0F|nr:chemotaxis protein CheX [Helicobacter burdigaliensis]
MLEILQEAFRQVILDTMQMTLEYGSKDLKAGYLSSIEMIFDNQSRLKTTFVCSKEFLTLMALQMLGEDNPDELTLQDLSQEIANLTIGLGKVLAIKEGINFNISTPNIFGEGEFDIKDCQSLNFVVSNTYCSFYLHSF